MSKTDDESPKKRKTRLKGTDTKRPCVDCGQTKDRFKDFKPRWAGCENHRTERGRRYYQEGCDACKAIVNGNIRQPRCIACDKSRTKKVKAKPAATVAESVTVESAAVQVEAPVPEAVEDHKSGVVLAQNADAESLSMPEVATADLDGLPERVEPEAEVEPVEPEVVGLVEPSPESVSVPEPTPAPKAKPAFARRPSIASMADLSKLFDADEPDSDSEEPDGE